MLLPWRTTGEFFLHRLCYSRIYNNIIFNYDGFSMKSKEELKIYRRERYLKDPKSRQAYARNYYYQHKEQIKKYRLKNKEKIKEYDKKYSLENKEKKKAYRLKNRERFRQWHKEYYQKNKQILKIRRYYQDELRVGAEAEIDGGTASKAITMALPNL